MSLNAEKIIELCQDAPVIEPKIPVYAMADINLGEKAHIIFDDREFFVIATSNTRKLYDHKTFAGYLVAVKQPSTIKDYFHLDYFGFYTTNTGLLCSGTNYDTTVRNLSDNGAIMLHFDRDDYCGIESSLLESDQGTYISHPDWFTKNLKEFKESDPHFVLKDGELLF